MAKFVWNAGVFIDSPLVAADTSTQITVTDMATGLPASIWSDYDGAVTKSNPFFISAPGNIVFYANAGRYTITAVNGASTHSWANEILGGGVPAVSSVVAGAGIVVDNTTPTAPIISSDFDSSSATASYTLAAVNNSQWMDLSGASNITITCPPESSINLGDEFVHMISNFGTGTVTIAAGSGVTVSAPPGGTLLVPRYATIGIKKVSYTSNAYVVFGPTVAS